VSTRIFFLIACLPLSKEIQPNIKLLWQKLNCLYYHTTDIKLLQYHICQFHYDIADLSAISIRFTIIIPHCGIIKNKEKEKKNPMNNEEFISIRRYLGKSQSQLAQLLCISTKAIQSFEQNWRKVPVYIERQLLVMILMKHNRSENLKPCWEIKRCATSCREVCIAWEYKSKYCWLISGTICEGRVQKSWEQKIKMCKECDVFKTMMPIHQHT
jgi:DNA-binding transcriptional regulator YiaG